MGRKLHLQSAAIGLLVHAAAALTSGPNQPEYAGFKSATQKDMVDLLSGDFGYSVPIMEVPGPGISYPLTLGSHSGIQVEQEASWVGLGWSLNPGAINRGLNRYPDDYYRGLQRSTFQGQDDVDAYSINAFVANFNWSENGEIRGGVNFLGLSASGGYAPWSGFSAGAGMFGMEYGFNSRSGIGFQSTPDFMAAVAAFASVAAMSPTDNGAADMSQNPPGKGQFSAADNGFLGAVSMGINVFNLTDMVADANFSLSGFLSRSVTVGAVKTDDENYIVYNHSESYVDKAENRRLYGFLNLGAYPKETSEALKNSCWMNLVWKPDATKPACSDLQGPEWSTKGHRMEFDYAQDQPEVPNLTMKSVPGGYQAMSLSFGRENSWAVSTQDGYSIKAEGVSLSYRPNRQDLGDYYAESGVVPPHQTWGRRTGMALLAGRHNLADRHKYDRAIGELASRFMQEKTGYANTVFDGMPLSVFRQVGDPAGVFDSETWRPGSTTASPDNPAWPGQPAHVREQLYLNRELLEDADPAYALLKKTPVFASANPDRISGSKGIFPRYKNTYDPATGWATGAGCTANRVPDIPECDPWVPEKALIGFTFIRPDGMIYEYNKPAFNWIYKSASAERPTDEFIEKNWGNNDFGSLKASNSLERPYAYAWLITAVKGPDYYDLNNDKKPSQSDIGAWVRFEYGKTIRNYHWRSPYVGTSPNGTGVDQIDKGDVDGDGTSTPGTMVNFKTYGTATWGIKDIHYLTAMYTPTHQARFTLSDRLDGLEAKTEEGGADFTLLSGQRSFTSPSIRPSVGDLLDIHQPGHVQPSYRIQVTAVTDNPPDGACTETNANFNSACNGTGRNQTIGFTVLTSPAPATFPSGSTIQMVSSARRLQKIDYVRLYENINDNSSVDGGESLLREAKFEYSYDLAPGIPNSVNAAGTSNNGKLALRKVTLGDGVSAFPPYTFKYYMEGAQAPYHRDHWDRWGYYKRNGGLEPSAFVLEDIINWGNLHTEIKSTSTHWLTVIIRANLGSRLAAIQAAATLDDDMRDDLMAALTKATRNLNFYAQNKVSIGARATLTPRPKKLFDRLATTNNASNVVIMDDNGSLKANLTVEEANDVEWFNNSVIEREYLWTSKTATGRSILKKTNLNRIDHDPNRDDVKAWSLRTVRMPSGGTIEAELESDDFAYEGRAKVVRVEKRRVDNEPTGAFFKSVGAEKTFSTGTDILEINEETFGRNFLNRVIQDPYAIEIKVESVFRLYREVKDGTGAKVVQFNKDFEYLRNRRDAPSSAAELDEDRLHLVAWYWPGDQSDQFWGGFSTGNCGLVPVTATPARSMIMPVPIDLGTVKDPNDATKPAFEMHAAGASPSTQPKDKFCQRGSVTFKLADLLTEKGQGGATACMAGSLAKSYYLSWTRKRDIRSSAPITDWQMDIKTAEGAWKIPDLRTSSPPWAYLSGTVRKGHGAWAPDLNEFEASRQDQPGVVEADFPSKYWDFYNFNTYVKAPRNFVGEGAGLIGGGVRTKRVVMHTGWAQKPGAPAQLQVAEYAYDGAGGFGGTYSSGSTPSIPPPFNNKGDDRRKRPESGTLIQQGPQVSYRTVACYRPGMGRTVHHFLTSADVEDYWAFDYCNLNDKCYDQLTNFAGNRQRWKLNRISHFQGQPRRIETYDEEGKLQAKTEMKYQVSMNQVDINSIAELSLLNNSEAFGATEVLVPTVSVIDQSGTNLLGVDLNSGYQQIGLHLRSGEMGKTTTRYRHRYNWHFELGCQEDVIYCATNNDPHGLDDPFSTMAVSEIEEVEHSIHPYKTTQVTDGVGTEETNSFWDFFSGTPLVKTKKALGDQARQRPVKTDVTIPAYWITEYNKGGQSLSMGSVYKDPDFRDVALGLLPVSSLSHRNMLTQTFSTSTYSGLAPYCNNCSTPDAAFWRDRLDDRNLFSRSILLWDTYGPSPNYSYRINGEKKLRMDMTSTKEIAGNSSSIKMPYPISGTVKDYYSDINVYPLVSKNTIIDNSGKYVEVEDAHGNATSFFYKDALYTVAQVSNAHRKDARVLTFDETRSPISLPDGWNISGTASFNPAAHSGVNSLDLAANSSLNLNMSGLTGGKYLLSFWKKRGSSDGMLTVNAGMTLIGIPTSGKEWTRIESPIWVAANGSIQLSITAGSGQLVLDDIRLAPADAQIYSMTYDKRGWKTSQSGPSDIATYFNYDELGRLTEVRDHQQMLISTQAQREAE